MREPPPPLEWHPAYAGHTWLRKWLDGAGPHAGADHVLVPRTRRVAWYAAPSEVLATSHQPIPHRLTLHRVRGPAPYVGQPFCYEWRVGCDELGRCVAGDAVIVHL